MTKIADCRGAGRACIALWLPILAIALAGCEDRPPRPSGPLPEADVPVASEAWRERTDTIAARPEVDRISYARSGEPIAIFFLRNKVSNDDLESLAELSTLRWMDLVDTGITDAGLVHLARLPQLETLYLNNIQVGDEGVAHLADLQELRMLHLGRTRISDAAILHLAKLPKLRELHLERTGVTDAGLAHLKEAPALEELYLTGSQVTEEGVAKLKADRPKLAISFQANPPMEVP